MAYKLIKEQKFGENLLILEFDEIHFAGFEKQNFYSVVYLTPHGEPNHWDANYSEYYLESELEMAMKAFDERASSKDNLFKHSSYSRPLEDFANA